MLAGFITINHIMDQVSNRKIILDSECKKLITKTQTQCTSTMTVNQHRGSDVDLELQIIKEMEILRNHNNDITIRYVKSRQDLKKLKCPLTYPEQLNIQADSLVKQARSLPDQKHYYQFPTNNVNFSINNDIIYSKYKTISTRSYHRMYIRDYMKKRYKWTNPIIDSIWWKPYYKSIGKLNSTDKLRIQKFIHDYLPTKLRNSMYYKFRKAKCTSCQCNDEDEDHILRCQTNNRKILRSKWSLNFKTFLANSNTPDLVQQVLYQGLDNWLEPEKHDISIKNNIINKISEDEPLRDIFIKAVESQAKIGWRHMIRGRLSQEWNHIMRAHYTVSKEKKYNAEKWGTMLNDIHCKHIIEIWNSRNEEVNGITNDEKRLKKKTKF
jgi:hypothetical protein